ncbi:MAG: hypothetical protein KDD46_06605 [Bdellovibrionales bacterium]|nr:hypothetical protein [Bdellovibrionales bacterium]
MEHPFLELLEGDKRKIKRIILPKPVQTTLHYFGEEIPVQLVNYSFSGMGLYIPSEYTKDEKVILAESKLMFPQTEFMGHLVYQKRKDNQVIQVGFALPREEKSRYLFKLNDPDWDEVSDVETVKNIYTDLTLIPFKYKVEIFQNKSAISFYPTKMTDSGTLIGEFDQTIQGKVQLGEAYCNFDLFQTYHVFQTQVLKLDDKNVEIRLSPKVYRLLRRETLRVEKKERDYELKVTLTSKILDQEFIDDQVFDYSEHGISLIDTEGKYAFPKGMPIEKITVDIKDQGTIMGEGVVRNYVWNPELKKYVIGLHFIKGGEPNITNWNNFILKARYPTLDFQYKDEDHKKIWDLFESSGYLDLKARDEFDDVREWTRETWKKLSETGSKFSRRIKIESDNHIVAHLQMDRMFPNTWYLHHLAIDPKSNKTIGKDIYFVSTDVFFGEKSEYLLTLTELSKKWNQKNYYDFIKQYPNPSFHDLEKFHLFEINIQDFSNYPSKTNYDINFADKYELKYIQKFLENNSSDLLFKAYSYDDDFELLNFKKELAQHGIERDRKFVVLKEKNKILGFSQLESCTSGINILSYFDLIYLFSTEEVSDDKKLEVFKNLINESTKYYKSKGKDKITLTVHGFEPDKISAKGVKYICEDLRWISLTSLSKKYQSFSKNLYGHMLLKRESIRERIKIKNEKKS